MGKRIDELPLDDTPFPEEPAEPAEPKDIRDTTWYAFVAEIDYLLGVGRSGWAEDTLLGIQETVTHTRRVTEGQRRAVANIQAASEARYEHKGRRRYEGFQR